MDRSAFIKTLKRSNEETLATALDHELVGKFTKKFMELYNGIYF